MEFIKKYKNFLFALFIIFLLGAFEVIQVYFYHENILSFSIETIPWEIFGAMVFYIIIPLIVSIISKITLKKNFAKVLLLWVIWFSIPLSLLIDYGHYSEHKKSQKAPFSEMTIEDMKKIEDMKNLKSALPVFKYDSEKVKDIKKLFGMMGWEFVYRSLNEQLNEIISPSKKIYSNIPEEFWNEYIQETSLNFFDLLIPIYDKYLTHDEIKTIIKFYESPVGEKLTSLLPQMTQEVMAEAKKWGEESAKNLFRKLDKTRLNNKKGGH